MCFGVRKAIKLALAAAARQPLTILGELVHNETVLEQLRARGIQLRSEVDDVDTSRVMITAHGASERRLAAVRDCGVERSHLFKRIGEFFCDRFVILV